MKKEISGIFFASMISALNDFMGVDGLNSILKIAKLDEYIGITPSKTHSIASDRFQTLIESIINVMGYGTDEILFHYGKNYLALKFIPYMTELSNFIMNLQEWLGGNWVIQKDNPNEKVIQIFNSPFSQPGSPKSHTSCHIIRGIFEIVMEQITGEKYTCEEKKCVVKGDNCCEFIVKK
ncbi:MAG: V4R domain-containing protein [Promethearchaeota archaeon]